MLQNTPTMYQHGHFFMGAERSKRRWAWGLRAYSQTNPCEHHMVFPNKFVGIYMRGLKTQGKTGHNQWNIHEYPIKRTGKIVVLVHGNVNKADNIHGTIGNNRIYATKCMFSLTAELIDVSYQGHDEHVRGASIVWLVVSIPLQNISQLG